MCYIEQPPRRLRRKLLPMRETAERLNALNRRLTMLLDEHRTLEYRWTLAAVRANDWPDTCRAAERFASLQSAAGHPDATTAS